MASTVHKLGAGGDDSWGESDDVTRVLEKPAHESALDAIRRYRETHVAEQHYDMVVPGYGELLVLRCAPLRGDAQTKTRLRLEKLERAKDPSRDFAINADTLVDVCEQVLARHTRDGELVSIDPSGEPVKIESRLADLLNVEAPTARELVKSIFAGVPSPEISVGVEVGRYLDWAQGVDSDVDEGLLGES